MALRAWPAVRVLGTLCVLTALGAVLGTVGWGLPRLCQALFWVICLRAPPGPGGSLCLLHCRRWRRSGEGENKFFQNFGPDARRGQQRGHLVWAREAELAIPGESLRKGLAGRTP